MRTYIYSETKFLVYKNRGGMYVPQHQSPFSNKYESFTEKGTTVIRARRCDAIKYIQRKAKTNNPPISFVDALEEQKAQPKPSQEDVATATLYTTKLQALNEKLNDPCLIKGGMGEQIILKQKQHIIDWFHSHHISLQA